MTTAPESKSKPPVYLTLRNQPEKGKPVADIELRYEGAVYEAELRAGKTKSGKRTLWGTAQPAEGRQRLELLFADAEREELAQVPEDSNAEYQNRPGQVLLFFNERGAELSGYFTVPETGEQLRPSVFMEGASYGTGPLQTEEQYRAALAERTAAASNAMAALGDTDQAEGDEALRDAEAEGEAPDAPPKARQRRDRGARPDSIE
ncbi:MAG: hypothetical protein ACLPPF_13160 [Rhodomicrobium sp.]